MHSLYYFLFRDSGGIRTHDPQLRRLLLYPTELRNQPIFDPKVKLRCKNNVFISFIQFLSTQKP